MVGINVSIGSTSGISSDGDGQFVKPSAPSPGGVPYPPPPVAKSSRSAPPGSSGVLVSTGSPMPALDMRSSVSPAPSPMDTSRGIDSEDDTRSVDGDGDK